MRIYLSVALGPPSPGADEGADDPAELLRTVVSSLESHQRGVSEGVMFHPVGSGYAASAVMLLDELMAPHELALDALTLVKEQVSRRQVVDFALAVHRELSPTEGLAGLVARARQAPSPTAEEARMAANASGVFLRATAPPEGEPNDCELRALLALCIRRNVG
jgi:hypothetical protein